MRRTLASVVSRGHISLAVAAAVIGGVVTYAVFRRRRPAALPERSRTFGHPAWVLP